MRRVSVAVVALLAVLATPLQASSSAADPPSLDAAARYLGLNRQELITRMCGGKSLAEIAKAQGKSAVGLRAEMHEAVRESLAADASLTEAQRNEMMGGGQGNAMMGR